MRDSDMQTCLPFANQCKAFADYCPGCNNWWLFILLISSHCNMNIVSFFLNVQGFLNIMSNGPWYIFKELLLPVRGLISIVAQSILTLSMVIKYNNVDNRVSVFVVPSFFLNFITQVLRYLVWYQSNICNFIFIYLRATWIYDIKTFFQKSRLRCSYCNSSIYRVLLKKIYK